MSAADQLISLIHRATASLRHALDMVASRIVVESVQDGSKLQGLKAMALADEPLEDIEHMQPGGLSHVPLAGAEGVLLCIAGRREHPIALCVSNRSTRPTGGQSGETVLYCSAPGGAGIKIKLNADGEIELTPSSKVTIVGDLEVTGEVTANTAVPAEKVTLTQHKHPTAMGPSGAPIPGM
jgi:phage gp45-like